MTTTQHTAGPWSQGEDNPLNIYGNHANVAKVHGSHPTGARTEEEAIANARLIAAAPELLAALREIAEMDGGGSWNTSEFHALCSIAKAAVAAATREEVQG